MTNAGINSEGAPRARGMSLIGQSYASRKYHAVEITAAAQPRVEGGTRKSYVSGERPCRVGGTRRNFAAFTQPIKPAGPSPSLRFNDPLLFFRISALFPTLWPRRVNASRAPLQLIITGIDSFALASTPRVYALRGVRRGGLKFTVSIY